MAQNINKHLDGQKLAELRDFKLKSLATDPTGADVYEGMLPFLHTVDDRLKYSPDGTNLKSLAHLEDVTAINAFRGVWDATTGIPTAAGSTVRSGDPIKAGDFWRVTTAGSITGLGGGDTVQVNDVIYATVDDANTASAFFAVEGNNNVAGGAGSTIVSSQTLASLPASTATDVNPPGTPTMTTIYGFQIFTATGQDVTDSFDVVLDNVTPKITITSLVAYANLDIKFVGE